MTTMTMEMRYTISDMMTEVCGEPWYDAEMTEEMCEQVCARCPYAAKCHETGLYFSCACWEEAQGEDL